MATNCTNCGCNKLDCGCKDSFLTTPAPCPTPEGCPDPQPCSEVFDAQCIIYNGDDIICEGPTGNLTTVVTEGTNVTNALNDIVNFVCQDATFTTEKIIYNGESIICDNTVVVPGEPGNLNQVLESIVDYFCNNTGSCCPTFAADIQPSLSLEWGLQVNLTNGTAPFTYQWSYAQNGDVGAFDDMRGILFNGSTTAQNVALTTSTKYYTSYDGEFSGSTHSTHVKVRVTDANGQIADAYYTVTRFFPAQ